MQKVFVAFVFSCVGAAVALGPTVSAAARTMDPKVEKKLLADYYRPGIATLRLERAVAAATGKVADGCGEYECTWEFVGEQGCVGVGEDVWQNGMSFTCECLDAGECYMVPLD